ncbi:MAG: hypothetical protein MJA83_08495, partial [Gammaproteobacteria bacterium]|nr:hypothetical protein [Gammaproteobacteria bacterium]
MTSRLGYVSLCQKYLTSTVQPGEVISMSQAIKLLVVGAGSLLVLMIALHISTASAQHGVGHGSGHDSQHQADHADHDGHAEHAVHEGHASHDVQAQHESDAEDGSVS